MQKFTFCLSRSSVNFRKDSDIRSEQQHQNFTHLNQQHWIQDQGVKNSPEVNFEFHTLKAI